MRRLVFVLMLVLDPPCSGLRMPTHGVASRLPAFPGSTHPVSRLTGHLGFAPSASMMMTTDAPAQSGVPVAPAVTPKGSTAPDANVVLVACLMMSIVTGSFYAWSLLLPSLQASLGCARAPLSAVFSFSTASFAFGTSFGPVLLSRLSDSAVAVLVAVVASSGLFTSSLAGTLPRFGLALLAVGWGACFGGMSGLAFANNAKISTSPLFAGHNGLVTGLIVAGRAAAPMVASPLILSSLARGGAAAALRALALYVGIALIPVGIALRGLTSYEQKGRAMSPATSDHKPARKPSGGVGVRVGPVCSGWRLAHLNISDYRSRLLTTDYASLPAISVAADDAPLPPPPTQSPTQRGKDPTQRDAPSGPHESAGALRSHHTFA